MSNTKKLLSITNLKKYFPIAKSSIFQKEQFYVRANEEITIDIHSGVNVESVEFDDLVAKLNDYLKDK